MEKQINELLVTTSRIEANTKHLMKSNDDQEKRIRGLEKKWWSSLGAIGIALAALVKSFLTHG